MLVITDSAAALPQALQAELNITEVPILVSANGQPVAENEASDSLAQATQPGVRFTTSAPTPGAFLEAIERQTTQHEAQLGCLVVTVSSQLSSCYQSARLAAQQTKVPVEVVDSKSAAGGQALVVVAAAQALKDARHRAGATARPHNPDGNPATPLEHAAAVARRVAGQVRLVGVLPEVDHLVRTGRIPPWAGWAAGKVNLKPIFEINRNGHIKRLRPAHSLAAARNRLVAMIGQSQPKRPATSQPPPASPQLHVCAVHSDDSPAAEALLEQVREQFQPHIARELCLGFGAALTAAAGPGVSGLAWWWDAASQPPQPQPH